MAIRSKLLEGGGVDVTEYGPDCTHLILDRTVYDDPICVAARRDGKVLVTNLWVEHSFDVGMVVDHLSIMYRPMRNLDGIPETKSLMLCLTLDISGKTEMILCSWRGCREASGGTVTDPNKAMVHINSHLSRKEKAKVQKAEKNNKIDTEDENLSLDSTRNSFSQALQVMKKTPITTSRVGGRGVNGGNLLANSSFSIGVMTNDGLSIQCGGNLGSGNFHVLTQLHGNVCYMSSSNGHWHSWLAFFSEVWPPSLVSQSKISLYKLRVVVNYIDDERYLMGFAFFAGANFLLTLVAAFLTVYFAPTTSGPRVLKINAYINGIIGSIGAISTGIDLGKGEPLIYFGNCIASLLGQGGSDNYKLSWHWLRYVNNDMDKRDLITYGSSSGVCAAFHAPVAGVLFALEEVATWWRSALIWRTFFSTVVVLVVQGLHGIFANLVVVDFLGEVDLSCLM
ncbi:hypothetical protein P3S68_031238 [Capsicum galapagoense]